MKVPQACTAWLVWDLDFHGVGTDEGLEVRGLVYAHCHTLKGAELQRCAMRWSRAIVFVAVMILYHQTMHATRDLGRELPRL